MPNFLFVYRQSFDTFKTMAPEEMQQQMQKWQTWLAEGFEKGWLLNAGDGLKKEGRVIDGRKIVMDGPFVESKEIVGGYSIVTAVSLDAAAELAKGCPCLAKDGSVEIRQLEGYQMTAK